MNKVLLGMVLVGTTTLAVNEVQTVGVAASYTNTMYKAENQFVPIPLINLSYERFFIRGLKPGFKIYEEPEFNFSIIVDPLAGYFDGWYINGSDMKEGYKNIDNRDYQFMYGLEANYNFTDDIFGTLGYMWGSDGSKGELAITHVKYLTDRLVFMPSFSLKYYDNKFVDYYVGVTKEEALKNSKIDREYNTNDSFTAGITITFEYAATEQTTISVFGGYDYFDDKIADSPIVDKNGQFYGGIGLRYSF